MEHTRTEWMSVWSGSDLNAVGADLLGKLPVLAHVISMPDYRYVYLNNATRYAFSTSGVPEPDLLIGMHPWEHELAWKERYLPHYEKVRQSCEPLVLDDFRAENNGVETFWKLFLVPNTSGEAGDVRSITAFAINTTEKTRAQILSEALNTINAAINSTLHFDEVMRRAMVESSEAIGADTGVLTLRDGENWTVRYVYGASQDIVGKQMTPSKATIPELLAASRRVLAIEDAEADERLHLPTTLRFGIKSVLALPLTARGEVTGAVVYRYTSPMTFGQAELDFAEKLAASISLAMENARLFGELEQAYERERHIADTLQKALVPAATEVSEGYAVSTWYEPAVKWQQIGGDFFDVFRTENGWTAVLIGDISGKGIEAAALAAAARNTLRAFAYEFPSPGEVLQHANSVLCNWQPLGSFATVFLALIEPETGVVRYSCAGHPPPLIGRPGGGVDLLEKGSPPLGLFEKLPFEEADERIESGGRMLFYTDGLSEARVSDKLFGLEGITSVVERCAHLPADTLAGELLRAAFPDTSGRSGDDTAIIVLDRGPSQ